MEQFHYFHDWLMVFVLSISIGTVSLLWIGNYTNRGFVEEQAIEFNWTLLPIFALITIVLPSLRLLYLIDNDRGGMTVKSIGRQWYWQYDYQCSSYISYLSGEYRLLRADSRLMLPFSSQIMVTAADVLHSWTIPRLAAKADAVPGRINKLSLLIRRPGIYFGQCREICGRNHRFIPISIECS